MRWIAIAFVLGVGCISQLTGATTPESDASGTLTCGAIVETCTSQCNDPLCVEGCKAHGSPPAQERYGVLVDCAKANRCFDEACIMASCQAEVDACKADGAPPPAPAATPAP